MKWLKAWWHWSTGGEGSTLVRPIIGLGGPILLGLFIIIAATSSSDSKTLTVEEYAAAACVSDLEDAEITWGEFQSRSESVAKLLREIDPPEAVRNYHQIVLASVKLLSEFANEQDRNAPVNPFMFITDVRFLALGLGIAEAEEELSDDVRLTLIEHGCIEDNDVE